jgi:hypothetical protein
MSATTHGGKPRWTTAAFGDQLVFSIALAVSRSRDLLRRILKDHVTDDVRQQLAERIVQDLEQSALSSTRREPGAQAASGDAPTRLAPAAA